MTAAQTAASYDEGLRTYFRKIYNTMTAGLLLTGLVAMVCASVPAIAVLFTKPLFAILFAFLPLILGMTLFNGGALMNKPASSLKARFYIFSAAFGLCLTPLVLIYAGADLARAFFVTAATFAGTSLWSYVTKSDLSKFGSFLFMGVLGLMIAIVVNMFLRSPMMDYIISMAGVLIYTGLVAWDTQNLKESYAASSGTEANDKLAIMGALSLYMNFIMLFQFILRLMGSNRN
ncbi:MAG: Bax inhibitor-1/YccA family protein [Rhodospirillales bacterium]|nr:Bax inhibitor-1/YccA family protein [Alphaproteobacteria bacterium]MCB9986569.1 Bax inhibitor-1/YccA family protein [Rhodospirillales bacterium]USO08600.1 MAG: Bax inhibitor-1/YccA family protein [Rhodospirillales bacterium]